MILFKEKILMSTHRNEFLEEMQIKSQSYVQIIEPPPHSKKGPFLKYAFSKYLFN